MTRAFCYLDIATNKRLLMCLQALDHTCRELIFTGKEMMAVFTSFYVEKQTVFTLDPKVMSGSCALEMLSVLPGHNCDSWFYSQVYIKTVR